MTLEEALIFLESRGVTSIGLSSRQVKETARYVQDRESLEEVEKMVIGSDNPVIIRMTQALLGMLVKEQINIANPEASGGLYENLHTWLMAKKYSSRARRFSDEDYTILSEFIDDCWPEILALAKPKEESMFKKNTFAEIKFKRLPLEDYVRYIYNQGT